MEAKTFADVWPNIYLFDLLRYLIPASAAFLIFWVLGRNAWKHLFIQKKFPNSRQLWKEFAYSMSTVVIFSLVGFGIYSAEHAGMTMIYANIDEYGLIYLGISLAITVVFHDFYFYWTHRLMHHKSVFSYVHCVHHQSTSPSPWAAYSFHPWEALIQAMVLPIMVFTIPLHPLVMFIFLAYMIVRNVMGHLGFEILPKGFTRNKWLNWNTATTHHDMHHEHFHSNYGLYFTWWDRWMRTEHENYHQTFDEVKSRPKVCDLKTKKRARVTVSVILISSTTLFAQSVEGKWITYHDKTGSPLSLIEIRKTGESIEGKVVQIFLEPFQGDDPVCTRCTGLRKDQKVIGMNFLWGFKRNGSVWSDGKILDPENGQMYNAKIWLDDDRTLRVRGYAGAFDLFYRTQTWKRKENTSGATAAGSWLTIDDTFNKVKSEVELVEMNNELRGYIRKIYLLPHEGTDPICMACEGKLKNKKIVGMKILSSFRWNGKKWEDGQILDPGNGNVYTSSVWLVNNDELHVRGFLGPFYRTQIWKRQRNEETP